MTARKPSPAILEKFAPHFVSGIFGGVIGLIGCFSFGFFTLVLYFIWQWGLTALLEIEFIFFYSSHMPLGCEAFVNKNVFFVILTHFQASFVL